MWFVVSGVCVGVAGALLFAGLLVERARRRRAEDRLRASRRDQRRLAGRIIEAQEGERRRVARELHDDLNQGLALLAVELDVLTGRPPPSARETEKHLRGLSARVKGLSSAVHAMSHQLHPSRLEQLGLVAAARGLCQEVSRHHRLEVTFIHSGVPAVVTRATALCLYRVAQEALRNVVRHSGAARAAVELAGTPADLRLVVSDDGTGFEPAAALRGGGLGLVSMRERLCLAGGRLVIAAREAGGTRIDARIPAAAPRSAGPKGPTPLPAPEAGEVRLPRTRALPRWKADGQRKPTEAGCGW
jgi:signal transduction histidine kinase